MARPQCGEGSVARCRLRPKFMNRCRPEEMYTKTHGQLLKIILKLEKREALDKNMRKDEKLRRREKSHKEGLCIVQGRI